jgi:uncharacterized protein (DUF58 family)
VAGERPARDRPAIIRRSAPDRRLALATVRPTARGAVVVLVAVAVGLIEVFTARPGLLPFVVLLGLPLVAAPILVWARCRRAMAVHVRTMVVPPLVAVGGHCELRIHLANEGENASPPLGLERPAEHSRSADRPAVEPTRLGRLLAAPSSRLIRWQPLGAAQAGSSMRALPTGRRGIFTIGPLALWVHDPFGLCARRVAVTPAVTLVVHPVRALSTPSLPLPGGDPGPLAPSRDGAHEARHDDDPGGELSGLRPYVPGDRLHLLSWPVEARYGLLMVHEFRPDGAAPVLIVLDDRAGVHRKAAFEESLSILYALVDREETGSRDVEIMTLTGGLLRVPPTPEGMAELLTFLAGARPSRRRASSLPLRGGSSTVVTTSTARDSLPATPGVLSVIEVEGG